MINNLVFEGGGVKGIAYAGAIEVLEEKGLLQDVKQVAGTSAGAITATLLALNYSSKNIKRAINDLDFKSLEDHFNPGRVLTHYGLYKGEVFLEWITGHITSTGLSPSATFEDLHNAKEYRNLKVFATDLFTKNIQEFSYSTTPKTIIAEAVRASMSIPMFFKAWQFSNSQPNDHIFVDGGVLYNYPFDIFENHEITMGFYLTDKHNQAKVESFGWNHPVKYMRATFDTLLKAQNVSFSKNREDIAHTVQIDDLGISATDFNLTDTMKTNLIKQGRLATTNFLKTEPHSSV